MVCHKYKLWIVCYFNVTLFINTAHGLYGVELYTVCVDSDTDAVVEPGCKSLGIETLVCTDMFPADPLGYENVLIKWCSPRHNEESLKINEELFMNPNWTVVKEFTFIKSQNIGFHTVIEPNAFKRLSKLEKVRLHILKSQLILNMMSFCGVDTLKSLNFSGSAYLQQHFISQIFNLQECMPHLEEFSLTGISLHHDLDFNDEFFTSIFRRPIRVLDLRKLHVRNLNITSVTRNCTYLEYLYLSDTMFENVDHGSPTKRVCPNLKEVDVSRAQFVFMKLLCLARNLGYVTTDVKVESDYEFLLDTETLVWDTLCPQNFAITRPINIQSAKLTLGTPNRLRHLYTRNNNFGKIDAEINWRSSSIEHLDLSNNSISYFNPGFFTYGEKFRHVSLTGNRLDLMVEHYPDEFEKLFTPLHDLRYLSLARNRIKGLPKHSFENNTRIEILDLSQNMLSMISFAYEMFENLTLLNVSGNTIDIKDHNFVINFNHYVDKFGIHRQKWLDISKNVISCNQSSDLEVVRWLLKSNMFFYNWNETKCKSENGSLILVSGDALNLVDEIRERPIRNRNRMILIALFIVLFSICYHQCKIYMQKKKEDRMRENRSILLQQNAAGHEFAVFLSSSSDDKDFVKYYVYDQLNGALQARLNVGRDLVFLSEIHMRGGPIKDGILDGLKRSAVLLLLLTDSIAESEWCQYEFKEACEIDTPILLMVKDTVDKDRLPENIRRFFLTNTRIMWEVDQNGIYRLQTTWNNVVNSILSAT